MKLNKIKLGLIKQFSLSTRRFITAINSLKTSKSPLFLNAYLTETKHLSEQYKTAMLKNETYKTIAFELVRTFQNR